MRLLIVSLDENDGVEKEYTVEPCYNDIGLCDTSSLAWYVLWPANSTLLTITFYFWL